MFISLFKKEPSGNLYYFVSQCVAVGFSGLRLHRIFVANGLARTANRFSLEHVLLSLTREKECATLERVLNSVGRLLWERD